MGRDRSSPEYRQQKRSIDKRYYDANPDKFAERRQKQRQACRDLVREAKDVPCADCGERYPYYVMDFDHREGEKKLFNIGGSERTGARLRILAEIAKCDVVCANCHRIRTHSRVV